MNSFFWQAILWGTVCSWFREDQKNFFPIPSPSTVSSLQPNLPEIQGFPFLSHILRAQVVWGCYNLTSNMRLGYDVLFFWNISSNAIPLRFQDAFRYWPWHQYPPILHQKLRVDFTRHLPFFNWKWSWTAMTETFREVLSRLVKQTWLDARWSPREIQGAWSWKRGSPRSPVVQWR